MHNDYPSKVLFDGVIYQTASHALNAARATDEIVKRRVQKAPTLSEMYNIARTIEDPDDWDFRKLKVMEAILRDKFRRHKDLRERLQQTGDREIVNTLTLANATNLFWGKVKNNGQN